MVSPTIGRRHTTDRRNRLLRPGIILSLVSLVLIAAVACGTDDGAQGTNSGVAAASFQVSEESITWSPPWQQGDSRSIAVESSIDPSDAIKSYIAQMQDGERHSQEIPATFDGTPGTVSFTAVGANGSTAEFDVAMQELLAELESQSLEQPGFGEADISGANVLLAFADQLDLGVEIGIDSAGTVTGVTNLAELAAEIDGLIGSLGQLAALAGGDTEGDDELARLQMLLEELPGTESAQLAADAAMNVATANMFLMRSGEYALGEPVIVSGNAPTMFGLVTDGTLTYELTELNATTATVEVLVSPGDVDLFQLMTDSANELAPLLDEESAEFANLPPQATENERAQFDLLTGLLLQPYTVTLTIDAQTGWVIAADWTIDLALPESFDEVVNDDDAFEKYTPEEFGVTITVSATFS